MTNLFIALAVIAIFAIGLLRALGVIGAGSPIDHPGKETK
jgi:hypothetical protein